MNEWINEFIANQNKQDMARNGTHRYYTQYHDKQRSRMKYVPIIKTYMLRSAAM